MRLTFSKLRVVCLSVVFVALFTVFASAASTTVQDVVSISCTSGSISGTGPVTIKVKGDTFSSVSSTITVQNTASTPQVLTFDYQFSGGSSHKYNNSSVSVDTGSVAAIMPGESVTFETTAAAWWGTASLILSNIVLTEVNSSSTVEFYFDNGSLSVGGEAVSNGNSVTVDVDGEAVVATATDIVGWIDMADNRVLSLDASFTLKPTGDMQVKALHDTAPHFLVGDYLFETLGEAITFATTASEKKIVLANSGGSLAAGTYTIPSGVTLLIPFDDAYTLYTSEPEATESSFVTPTAYRTLTMADGAKIVVNGAMSVSGKHCAKMGSNGLPSGPQGFVVMEKGSSITVNSGGNLYAWGYIVGEKRSANTETPKGGTVTIKNGGTIYECFQVTDYRGGDATSNMASSYGDNIKTYRVFPMSQYYIQNVQVPMTLEAGAAEIGYMSVTVTLFGVQSAPVPFIGSNGLFRIGSGSITKDYDEQNDRLVIDINGDLTMSTMTINIKVGAFGTNVDLDSSQYVLPMAGNMTVNINDKSTVTLAQDLAVIPGCVLNIAEGATVNIGTSSQAQNLYVYDQSEWGGYCYSSSVTYRALSYAYDRFAKRTEASLVDAKILVNGTLDSTYGYVYTTESGANICSTGTGVFKVGTLGTQTATYQATQSGTDVSYSSITIASAWLENEEDDSYVKTADHDNSVTYNYAHHTCVHESGTTTVAHGKWFAGEHTFDSTTGLCACGHVSAVAVWINGSTVVYYETLADAVSAYTGSGYIQMLLDSSDETTISKTVYLDLNGCDVSGVILSGTLYGMDSKTDGYESGKEGSIEVSISGGTVATVTEFKGKNNVDNDTATLHRYLAVNTSGTTWQFHRFNISVTDYYLEVLSTGAARIGFGSTFRGDSDVITALTDMGFTVNGALKWAGKANLGTITNPYKLYYTVKTSEMGNNTAIALVKFGESTEWESDEKTVNFLSALKTYYGNKADERQRAIIDKFMTAKKYTWPEA